MDNESDFWSVTEGEAGERLDKLLHRHFEGRYSRSYFQHLIDEGLVLLNGSPVKKRIQPQIGDEIEVQFALTPEITLASEAIDLSIIYEDDDLIVVNKPAGMVVHPAPGNWSHTFVNALLYHCGQIECEAGTLRPGIVHRLDKDTSGVLVAAKTLQCQQKLSALFASRQVTKEYIAVCYGIPPEGEIATLIGRHPIHRKEMAVGPHGKMAVSFVTVLGKESHLSVVKVSIATGRTHQIRVHLKHKGSPVLGDLVYGVPSANRTYKVHRQLLHASLLQFKHPITGELLELKAPIPEDMLPFLQQMKVEVFS